MQAKRRENENLYFALMMIALKGTLTSRIYSFLPTYLYLCHLVKSGAGNTQSYIAKCCLCQDDGRTDGRTDGLKLRNSGASQMKLRVVRSHKHNQVCNVLSVGVVESLITPIHIQ